MSGAKPLFSEDVVAALFAHYPTDSFKADTTILQEAFGRLKDTYPELLYPVAFDQSTILRRSEDLVTALESLGRARLLQRMNPDLRTYQLRKERLGEYYERYLRGALEEEGFEEAKIRSAAVDLANEIASVVQDLAGIGTT